MRSDLSDTVIIFDLDGTLVDTAGDLAAAMNYALQQAGRPPVEAGRVRHLVGHGARAMLLKGFQETGQTPAPEAMDRHVAVFLGYYLDHIADHSRPFEGAVEAIEKMLRAGAKAAICTNKREAPARLLIDTLGLSGLFSAIVGMDTTMAAKPDPAPVRLAIEQTSARRGVFIGDSDTDIRAAAATGIPCFVSTFGYGPVTLASEAAGLFDHYSELTGLIDKALADIR